MAQNVSTAFVTLFESEVKQAYQAEALLRGTMRARTNVAGNTVKFPKIGKGVATVRVPQTDVTPLNVTYSQVTATLTDYPLWVLIFSLWVIVMKVAFQNHRHVRVLHGTKMH